VAAGRTTLTEPYEDAATNELIITVATPAQAGGQTLGVIGGDLSLKVLVDIINSLDFNGMGHAFLVSADGKILVHPDKTKVNKTLSELYPQNTPSLTSRYAEASLDGNERILAFSPVEGLPSVKWYVGISVDRDKAYASLASFRTSAFVATAVAVLFIIALLGMLIRVLMRPLTDMGRAMANIAEGEGDLTRRLAVQSNDEFGQLAAGFNLMAQSLQSSHAELEDKVREKTASLNVQHQQLQALYAVSVQASEAASLQSLAEGFVRQVRLAAQADAATVRWSDEANERYVLLAGDGLPQSMSVQEHCLHTGACLCGQPREQARLRVIPITPASDLQLPHCREAGFETVVSIPVQLQQRLLGEVNLFFRSSVVLTDDMRDLLSAMARHLASAMESLRATALEREAAVAEERGLIARELHDSIAQSLAFLKIQTQLLRDAVAKGRDEARDRSLGELEVGVRECYADVRELLVHFRTRTSAEDIEAALRATLSKFEHQTGIATSLSMTGQGLPLAPDVQIQVLHMVQEALSNVRKHAGARHVELRVGRHPWRFEVCDDGCGFVPADVAPDSLHVGLGIMRERALLAQALVHVHSRPGEGTRVLIELPPSALAGAPAQALPSNA